MTILGGSRLNGQFDFRTELLKVQNHVGRGAWRQAWDILTLWLQRPRLGPVDYYLYGLYRPGFSRQRRRDYVAFGNEMRFHADLSGPAYAGFAKRLSDKIEVENLLAAAGVASPQTRALYCLDPAKGFAGATLHSLSGLIDYLSVQARYPLFGKPRFGSHAEGAILIEDRVGSGDLRLADGRICAIPDLAAEIVTRFAQGYLFQTPLRNHAVLRPHFGLATAATRMCTILGPEGPELLYAAQRLPTQGAMHDGSTGGGRRGFGRIDPETGEITAVRLRGAPYLPDMDRWNDPSAPLVGLTLPHFQAAKDLAIRAHRAIGQIAVVGFDVVIGDDAPVIMEANSNPYTIIYQIAFDRGILSAENRGRFEQARAIAALGNDQTPY